MKTKSFIIIGVLILILYITFPFFTTIFSSFLIAYLIEPFVSKLNKLIKNRNVSSFFLTIISVCLFSFFYYLFTRMMIFSLIQIQSVLDTNILSLSNLLSNYIIQSNPRNLVDFFESIFLNAPKLVLDLLLMSFLVFYLIRDFSKLKNKFLKFFNKNEQSKINFFLTRVNDLINNILGEFFLVGIIIGIIVFISLSFLNISYALELSTIALIMSTFPVISGWMLVLFLSIYYFIKESFLYSIIFFILSIILTLIDYHLMLIFRVRGGINHLLLVLGLISGVTSLGLFGFIAGPILAGIVQAGYETIFSKSFQY